MHLIVRTTLKSNLVTRALNIYNRILINSILVHSHAHIIHIIQQASRCNGAMPIAKRTSLPGNCLLQQESLCLHPRTSKGSFHLLTCICVIEKRNVKCLKSHLSNHVTRRIAASVRNFLMIKESKQYQYEQARKYERNER